MTALKHDELLRRLRRLAGSTDTETAHAEADALLLMFIDDKEITETYDVIEKWYS